MARPPKPAGTKLEDQIRVRLTPDQKREFDEVARLEGLDTASWFRHLATREAQRVRRAQRAAGERPEGGAPSTPDPEAGP